MQAFKTTIESTPFQFTFARLERYYREILALGYEVLRCVDYLAYKAEKRTHPILVNRVDIDGSMKKAKRLGQLFNRLGIPATFFVRLHAPEYNPFGFEEYRSLVALKNAGFEIGYHSEVIDAATIWQEDAIDCFNRDITILETLMDLKVEGVASHGGMTGLNNLSFWETKKPRDFGLRYEAYDREPEFDLFHHALYVSDSCWTYWKSYRHGQLLPQDTRSFAEHAKEDRPPVIYLLIHPETYYDYHFYE